MGDYQPETNDEGQLYRCIEVNEESIIEEIFQEKIELQDNNFLLEEANNQLTNTVTISTNLLGTCEINLEEYKILLENAQNEIENANEKSHKGHCMI